MIKSILSSIGKDTYLYVFMPWGKSNSGNKTRITNKNPLILMEHLFYYLCDITEPEGFAYKTFNSHISKDIFFIR